MKNEPPGFGLGAPPGVFLAGEGAVISADDLIEAAGDEFRRQSEPLPTDDEIHTLCRVIAGYLRTSPLLLASADDTRDAAIAVFLGSHPSRSMFDDGGYALVATLLDDGFRQRTVSVPPTPALDVLHRLTVGMMRRRILPRSHAAQRAMADWTTSLYLAGSDEW